MLSPDVEGQEQASFLPVSGVVNIFCTESFIIRPELIQNATVICLRIWSVTGRNQEGNETESELKERSQMGGSEGRWGVSGRR